MGVEDWPPSQCIPSASPVVCGGVIEDEDELKEEEPTGNKDDHLILVTFINRTVSLLSFNKEFTVLKHLGLFRNFFHCNDTSK